MQSLRGWHSFLEVLLLLVDLHNDTRIPPPDSTSTPHPVLFPTDPSIQIIPNMENQMEKKMEHAKEPGVIKVPI